MPDLPAAPQRPDAASHANVVSPPARHSSLAAKPAVSVVLGSLNRLPLLKPAIASVRAAVGHVDAEIVVIDGGSTDGSVEWLCGQSDIISIVQQNRFQVDGRQMRRRSWGAFMNIAFRAAAAPHVLMISDDCLLVPDAYTRAQARIREAEEEGVKVGACAFYFRNWPAEDRYYVQRSIGGNLMVNHGIYSKEALEACGYANEDDYVFYKADTDLSLRIWEAGYAIIDSPGSICEHYIGVKEALRESNNAVMENDREAMRRLWPNLVDKAGVSKMGKIYLDAQPGKLADATWQEIRDRELSERS